MSSELHRPLPPSRVSPPDTWLDRLANLMRSHWQTPVVIGTAAVIAFGAGIIPGTAFIVLGAIAGSVLAIYGFARYTEETVALSVAAASWFGGLAILAMPPLLVFAGAQFAGRRFDRPWNLRRSLSTAGLAFVAFVIGLLTADLSFSPSSSDNGSAGSATESLEPVQGGADDESTMGRLLSSIASGLESLIELVVGEDSEPRSGDEVGAGSGSGVGSVSGEGSLEPGLAQPPPSFPSNWVLFIIIGALTALAVLAWWLWNRRRNSPSTANGRWSIERLEAIGERVGRKRRPNEGAISYGRALSAFTSDHRLASAGGLVSGDVYGSASIEPDAVRQTLSGIEAEPPPKPPKRRVRRSFVASRRFFVLLREHPLGTAALLAVIVASAWLIANPPSAFGNLNDAQPITAFGSNEPYEFDVIRDDTGRVIGQHEDDYYLDVSPPAPGPTTSTPIASIGLEPRWGDSWFGLVDWPAGYRASTWTSDFEGWPIAIQLKGLETAPVSNWRMDPTFAASQSNVLIWFNGASVELTDEFYDLLPTDPSDASVPGFQSDEALFMFFDLAPLVMGYDADGNIVSIVVIDDLTRWRGLNLSGTAPDEILEREAALAACVEDPSLLNEYQYCQVREWWE